MPRGEMEPRIANTAVFSVSFPMLISPEVGAQEQYRSGYHRLIEPFFKSPCIQFSDGVRASLVFGQNIDQVVRVFLFF